MIDLLPISIGVGLGIGLLFSEFFGVAPGGMVVPGYLALYLTRPVDVALTLVAGLLTFLAVRALSTFVVVYGRRRTALMVLFGYLVGRLMRLILLDVLPLADSAEFAVIGFIIPGLIAIWLDRQGVVETVAASLTVSVLVRMVLVLAIGNDLASV